MTVIAAIAHEGKVWMGADTLTSYGPTAIVGTQSKIFKLRNTDSGVEWLFGIAGDPRYSIIQYFLEIPTLEEVSDLPQVLVTGVIPSMLRIYEEHRCLGKTTKNQIELTETTILIGVKGVIVHISANLAYTFPSLPYGATGSGGSEARAALHATKGLGLLPRDRLTLALETAAEFDRSVRGPFTILEA